MQIKSWNVGFAYVCSLLRQCFPNNGDVPLYRGVWNKIVIGKAGRFSREKRNTKITKIRRFDAINDDIYFKF